jgi:transcription antitermination protein NusB
MADPAAPPRGLARRRAARIGAVQALYQIELTGAPAPSVIVEFEAHRLRDLFEALDLDQPAPNVDRPWFRLLVSGVIAHKDALDREITARLGLGWSMERLGYLARACLRAGAFELAHRKDVPVKVVIDEYVDIGHGFLDQADRGFVNAVLDRLGREFRPPAEGEGEG